MKILANQNGLPRQGYTELDNKLSNRYDLKCESCQGNFKKVYYAQLCIDCHGKIKHLNAKGFLKAYEKLTIEEQNAVFKKLLDYREATYSARG